MKKVILIILITISLLLFLLQPTLLFIVEDADNYKILYREEIIPGFQFATKIRHSVQRTPVYEYYEVERDGSLLVKSTVLQDLGWGMPSNLEHKVKFENNFMIMDEINRKIDVLHFRISYIAEPCLIIDDKILDLKIVSQDSNLIKIYTDKMPFIVAKLRRAINVFQEKETGVN